MKKCSKDPEFKKHFLLNLVEGKHHDFIINEIERQSNTVNPVLAYLEDDFKKFKNNPLFSVLEEMSLSDRSLLDDMLGKVSQ